MRVRHPLLLLVAFLISGGFYVGPPVILALVNAANNLSLSDEADEAYVEGEGDDEDYVDAVFADEPAAAPEPPAAEPPPPPAAAPPPPPPPANMDAVVDPLAEAPVEAPVEPPPPELPPVVEAPPITPPPENDFLDPDADAEEEEGALADAAETAPKGPLGLRRSKGTKLGDKPSKGGGKKGKGKKCLPADPRIVQLGMYEYRIDGALIEYYADHLGEAMKLAWADWHKDERGDVDGFSVRHMRCGSPLHQAGLRNNDVIHQINGKDIRSIPAALGAFRKLQKKDVLKVELTRKGERVRIRYEIDDGEPERRVFRRGKNKEGAEAAPPAQP
jgi:hypothetical protein